MRRRVILGTSDKRFSRKLRQPFQPFTLNALIGTAGLPLVPPFLWKGEPMSPETAELSFDELTRGLASGSISRGKALRLMGAALVGGAGITGHR